MKSNRQDKISFIGLILLLTFSFYGCTKTKKYEVYLYFTKFESRTRATAGQIVQARVQLMYPTTSFPINAISFQTKSLANNHFMISAHGELTSHGETTQNTAELLIDTVFQIQTKLKGSRI